VSWERLGHHLEGAIQPSDGEEIAEDEPVARYDLAQPTRDGLAVNGSVPDERVELAVLSAGIDSRGGLPPRPRVPSQMLEHEPVLANRDVQAGELLLSFGRRDRRAVLDRV
jgi:hypothetical protein